MLVSGCLSRLVVIGACQAEQSSGKQCNLPPSFLDDHCDSSLSCEVYACGKSAKDMFSLSPWKSQD